MTTLQIILLSILAILTIIAYFGTAMSKKEKSKMIYVILWLFTSTILFLISLITLETNAELEKLKSKCPEYQKIENVYILKP
jgi:cbb3-type cytochrome oxidase subunit 1